MRTFSHAWHVPLALAAGAAIASNPRFFPAEPAPPAFAPVSRPSAPVPVNGPSPDIVAGLETAGRSGPESPELRALRLAEAQLFADDVVGQDADWGDDPAPRARADFGGDSYEREREFESDAGGGMLEGLVLPELGNLQHRSVEKYLR